MPIVQVSVLEGRPPEKYEELGKALTETIVSVLDAPAQSVRIVITEVPKSKWFVAGTSKAKATQTQDG